MTSRDFAFWLQGTFEVLDPKTLDEKEVEIIKKHLSLVFKHEIDPSMGDQNHQNELNDIHTGVYTFGGDSVDGNHKWKNKPFPTTEEEAILMYGPKPEPHYEFNIHGWYDPKLGQPRC